MTTTAYDMPNRYALYTRSRHEMFVKSNLLKKEASWRISVKFEEIESKILDLKARKLHKQQ